MNAWSSSPWLRYRRLLIGTGGLVVLAVLAFGTTGLYWGLWIAGHFMIGWLVELALTRVIMNWGHRRWRRLAEREGWNEALLFTRDPRMLIEGLGIPLSLAATAPLGYAGLLNEAFPLVTHTLLILFGILAFLVIQGTGPNAVVWDREGLALLRWSKRLETLRWAEQDWWVVEARGGFEFGSPKREVRRIECDEFLQCELLADCFAALAETRRRPARTLRVLPASGPQPAVEWQAA